MLEDVLHGFHTLLLVVLQVFKSWLEFFYTPKKDLKGEIVLLTGAAGDIGKLVAKILAGKGCKLVLWDISEIELKTFASELNQEFNHNTAYPYKCDITNHKEVDEVTLSVINDVGYPTIVVNNAAIVSGKYIMDLSISQVKNVFDVNVLSHYHIVNKFLPHMLENNHGHIVCIASILGLDSFAGVCDYGPSKAAAIAFMKSLRHEIRLLGKDKVYCTTVLPFHIKATLFSGCTIKPSRILSSLQPSYVAEKIVGAIEKNQIMLYIPRLLYFSIAALSVLPDKVADMLYDFHGVNETMKTFTGRRSVKIPGKEN